jgi:hypothetical protein
MAFNKDTQGNASQYTDVKRMLLSEGEDYWGIYELLGQMRATSVAYLTDVVGQRTVKVSASIKIDGIVYRDSTEVTFGKGPLSNFTSAPFSDPPFAILPEEGVKWTRDTLRFPAITEICHGSVDSEGWTLLENNPNKAYHFFLERSNLPDFSDLETVDMSYGFGAASAAGWPASRNYATRTIEVEPRYLRLVPNIVRDREYEYPIGASGQRTSTTYVVCFERKLDD